MAEPDQHTSQSRKWQLIGKSQWCCCKHSKHEFTSAIKRILLSTVMANFHLGLSHKLMHFWASVNLHGLISAAKYMNKLTSVLASGC